MTSANRSAGRQRVWDFGERLAVRKRRRSPEREALVAKTSCSSWEAGGLRDASEVSQGPGTGRQTRGPEGAGCQFAEVGVGARKGKDVGASFGKMLQPGLRMLEMV